MLTEVLLIDVICEQRGSRTTTFGPRLSEAPGGLRDGIRSPWCPMSSVKHARGERSGRAGVVRCSGEPLPWWLPGCVASQLP